LTRADGAQNPKSGLPRDVKRTCIKKSNKEEKDTLRHQGGVQHACTPKTWSRGTGPYFGCPTLCQLTNQRRRLGGRTGCRSLEKVRVRHARASRTTCHDRCQGCTVSFARHARPSTNLLDKPSLPDATSCPRGSDSSCGGSFGLRDQQAPTRYCMATTTFQGCVHASARTA
jgi:hypothetical protein